MCRLALLSLLIVASAFAQERQVGDYHDLDKCNAAMKAIYAVGLNHEARIDQLEKENAALRDKGDQWQAWYDQNWLPVKTENDRLNAQNSETVLRIFVVFIGIGAGIFLAWGAAKAVRRWWPVSKQRRQLITLLVVATWVTVAAVVAAGDSHLADHPVNLVFSVFVYSLPALAFGAVGVWWFGRTKPEVLW